MHPFLKTLAVIGAVAIVVFVLAIRGIVNALENGYETGGDHRSEEEREKDGSR